MKLASFRYRDRDRNGFSVGGFLADVAAAIGELENPVRRLPQ